MEPLHNLLTIYGDKQKVLLHYLPYKSTTKLDNHGTNKSRCHRWR